MHSYSAVMKMLINMLKQLARVSLKVGTRYYIDYSQASLTTMDTNARMLCAILAPTVLTFYVHVNFFYIE